MINKRSSKKNIIKRKFEKISQPIKDNLQEVV